MLVSVLFGFVFFYVGAKESYKAGIVSLDEEVSWEEYVLMMGKAKMGGAEIILYPEWSLKKVYPDKVENVTVGINPCESRDRSRPIQRWMSCGAREMKIYAVFDIAEKGESCRIHQDPHCHLGFYVYNTLVVLDREGTVITKYRKIHPFDEIITPGKNAATYFDTDFGVRFGIFVCYDITFQNPARDLVTKHKINNLLFSTNWEDRYFAKVKQVAQGWSEFYGVNLLASDNLKTSTGSGAFSKGYPLHTTSEKKDLVMVVEVPIFEFSPPPVLQRLSGPFSLQNNSKIVKPQPGVLENLTISVPGIFDCKWSYELTSETDDIFLFVAMRMALNQQGVGEADVCLVMNCGTDPRGMESCLNNKKSETSFSTFVLCMEILKEDVMHVLPLISANEDQLFEKFPFEIFHNFTSHMLKISSESPLLYASHVAQRVQ